MNRIVSGHRAVLAISKGMEELSRIVSTTYGPLGGKVIVEKNGSTLVTTDGASLVREAVFSDVRRLGVSLCRSTSDKTDESVGDGTTTSIILANSIVQHAIKLYTSGYDPVNIVGGIRVGFDKVEEFVRSMSVEVDDDILKRVAIISSHNDELVVNSVLESIYYVGENGTITVVPGESTGIELDKRNGLVIRSGWSSYHFSGNLPERDMEGPLVVVFSYPIDSTEDIKDCLEESSQWPGRGLVVFAPSITGEALTTMIVNDKNDIVKSVGVSYKGPPNGVGGWLQNVAAVTASTIIEKHDSTFSAEKFGSARNIKISEKTTSILSYQEENFIESIRKRTVELECLIKNSKSDYDRDRYTEIMSSINGGFCQMKVGGYTNSEAQQRRSVAEDTLHACRSCLSGGVVPGAGMALFMASACLGDTIGEKVLFGSIQTPSRMLIEKSGHNSSVVVEKILDSCANNDSYWVGWDPIEKIVRDFLKSPHIIDPTEVVINSLKTAVSVACQIINTGLLIHK